MTDHKITYRPQATRVGKVNVGTYVQPALKEALIRRAKAERRSQGFILREALEAYLKPKKKTPA